jgi:hypothetical protein
MFELAGSLFLVLAIWCWWKSVRAIVRGRRSRSWPVTDGVIRTVRTFRKNNRRGVPVWSQDVAYSYAVGGAQYEARRIEFGVPNRLLWSNTTTPIRERGERVEVFYDPSRPSVSALHRGFSPFALVTIAAGAVLAWMSYGVLSVP